MPVVLIIIFFFYPYPLSVAKDSTSFTLKQYAAKITSCTFLNFRRKGQEKDQHELVFHLQKVVVIRLQVEKLWLRFLHTVAQYLLTTSQIEAISVLINLQLSYLFETQVF